MSGGKQMAALLVKPEDGDDGSAADAETLDALSRKMILAVQKSDEKAFTDALRTFALECRKDEEPDGDEED